MIQNPEKNECLEWCLKNVKSKDKVKDSTA